MLLNVEKTKDLFLLGRTEFLPFYGHKNTGKIDDACLSNWYPAPFEHSNVWYTDTEQYMMAQKALLFMDANEKDNRIIYDNIMGSKYNPYRCKQLGKTVRGFKEEVWEENIIRIMTEGLYAKFTQNNNQGEFLKKFSGIFVEAAPRDYKWGIRCYKHSSSAVDPFMWEGENLLGFLLSHVRDIIINRTDDYYDYSKENMRKLVLPGEYVSAEIVKNILKTYSKTLMYIVFTGEGKWRYSPYNENEQLTHVSNNAIISMLKLTGNDCTILFQDKEVAVSQKIKGDFMVCTELIEECIKKYNLQNYIVINNMHIKTKS